MHKYLFLFLPVLLNTLMTNAAEYAAVTTSKDGDEIFLTEDAWIHIHDGKPLPNGFSGGHDFNTYFSSNSKANISIVYDHVVNGIIVESKKGNAFNEILQMIADGRANEAGYHSFFPHGTPFYLSKLTPSFICNAFAAAIAKAQIKRLKKGNYLIWIDFENVKMQGIYKRLPNGKYAIKSAFPEIEYHYRLKHNSGNTTVDPSNYSVWDETAERWVRQGARSSMAVLETSCSNRAPLDTSLAIIHNLLPKQTRDDFEAAVDKAIIANPVAALRRIVDATAAPGQTIICSLNEHYSGQIETSQLIVENQLTEHFKNVLGQAKIFSITDIVLNNPFLANDAFSKLYCEYEKINSDDAKPIKMHLLKFLMSTQNPENRIHFNAVGYRGNKCVLNRTQIENRSGQKIGPHVALEMIETALTFRHKKLAMNHPYHTLPNDFIDAVEPFFDVVVDEFLKKFLTPELRTSMEDNRVALMAARLNFSKQHFALQATTITDDNADAKFTPSAGPIYLKIWRTEKMHEVIVSFFHP